MYLIYFIKNFKLENIKNHNKINVKNYYKNPALAY